MATLETDIAGGVSFALTNEQRELRGLAREFAEKEIRPKAAEYDEHQTHPADIIAKAHEVIHEPSPARVARRPGACVLRGDAGRELNFAARDRHVDLRQRSRGPTGS